MSLRTTADKMALKILKVFDSFRVVVKYEHYTAGTPIYDVVSDTLVAPSEGYTFRGLFVRDEALEQEGAASTTGNFVEPPSTQAKSNLLFARLDVKDSFTASVGDTLTVGLEKWRVVDVKSPPGASVFKLAVIRDH